MPFDPPAQWIPAPLGGSGFKRKSMTDQLTCFLSLTERANLHSFNFFFIQAPSGPLTVIRSSRRLKGLSQDSGSIPVPSWYSIGVFWNKTCRADKSPLMC